MVQSQFSPPELFQLFPQKARLLDLGSLAYQLMHPSQGYGWSKAQAERGIARYLAYLYLLNQYPDLPLVPTQEIDQVWHKHILDTQKYAEDCQNLFGRFIHHFPYFGKCGEADQYQWHQAYAQTQALFQKHFGIDFGEATPADCEPLRLLPACQAVITIRQRPTVAISSEELIQLFPSRN